MIDSKLKQCEICKNAEALYTCPRCNIIYCNLKCYRDQVNHLNCSESFYQDQVVEELKMCQIDDKEERSRMVQILKKNVKELEKENILPDESDNDSSDNDDTIIDEKSITDNELIRTYESEILKWNPWWSKLNSTSILELDFRSFNLKLVKKSQNVMVANASPLIQNDLIQLFFIYSVIACVYQLDEETSENNFNEEIVLNMLQIDQLSKKLIPNKSNLLTKINLTFKLMLEEQTLFLRDYINKTFLLKLLNDETKCLFKNPIIIFKLISVLYNSFRRFAKSDVLQKQLPELEKNETESNEIPINVFYYNKSVPVHYNKEMHTKQKKSRVEIIRNSNSSTAKKLTTNNQLEKSVDSLKEAKIFLRRLEFYFKWFQLNHNNFIKLEQDFEQVKESISKEYNQLNEEKEFMQNNLSKLRAQINKTNNSVLIEEIK